MKQRRRVRYYILGGLVAAIAALVLLWNWDWFIPLAERQASTALGRPVKITHLHVQIGLHPTIAADGITIANPDGFPADAPFATIDRLAVTVDIPAYIHDRSVDIPTIDVQHPVVMARALPDGRNNWTLGSKAGSASSSSSKPPRLGALRIEDGHVHVVDPALKSDFNLDVATGEAPAGAAPDASGDSSRIIVDAKGTYAAQPITGRFVGGALLSLRDPAKPYPVDLQLASGPTHVSLVGTVQDPVAFAGADLKLHLAGPDLSLLYSLTGVAIPQTPPFDLTGQLDYAEKRIKFSNLQGRVGSSDLEGEIDVAPGGERAQVTASLASKNVDLADLGGFIGSTPGRAATPNQTAQQRAALSRAEASPQLIPNTPINLPKLRAADVELHYSGAHIQGRSIPFDAIRTDMTIKNGNLDLHPIALSVGKGQIAGTIALNGEQDAVHAKADIDFRQVDLARIMSSTHSFAGSGTIGGKAVIDGTGSSLAALLGNGNGELKLYMSAGGDLSALLIDLSGLQFGNAVLSALGVPSRAQVRCLVTDFVLRRGILDTKTMLLDTTEANVTGTGSVNLRDETVDYKLRTEPKHFTIGSLPAPINITGKLKSPSILPDAKVLAERAGAAIGLGIVLTPLAALLPTIQLGLGEDNNCGPLLHSAEAAPQVPAVATQRAAPPRPTPERANRR